MSIGAQQVAKELIAYSIVTDKGSIVKLLERNGVQMPNNPSDREVTAAVLTASAKSSNFKNELAKFLGSKIPQATEDYNSFVGDETDFGFTGIDDFLNAKGDKAAKREAARQARVTQTNPKGKTGFGLFLQNLGASLTSQETINTGINVGLTAVNNRIQGRSNAIQQETVAITERQDQIRQQLPASAKRGMGTMGWVLVGLGVIALGTTIYFVAKKK